MMKEVLVHGWFLSADVVSGPEQSVLELEHA
jgi:hypothetical protein